MKNSDSTSGIEVIPVTPPTSVTFLKNRVMIGLSWGKMTNPITAFAVAQLQDRRRATTAICHGDAMVSHSRRAISDAFLGSTCDYLLMIDDDMIPPFGNSEWFRANCGWENYPDPYASFNTIDRLLSHGKTLVGALYKGRYGKSNFVYGEGHNAQEREFAARGPHDLVKATRWVGTGCLLIHRSVFEDIEKKFPLLARGADKKGGNWFSSSEHSLADHVYRTRALLGDGPMTAEKALRAYEMLEHAAREAKANSTLGIGEDVQFCLRAAEAGHIPHVDLGLRAGHIGHYVY